MAMQRSSVSRVPRSWLLASALVAVIAVVSVGAQSVAYQRCSAFDGDQALCTNASRHTCTAASCAAVGHACAWCAAASLCMDVDVCRNSSSHSPPSSLCTSYSTLTLDSNATAVAAQCPRGTDSGGGGSSSSSSTPNPLYLLFILVPIALFLVLCAKRPQDAAKTREEMAAQIAAARAKVYDDPTLVVVANNPHLNAGDAAADAPPHTDATGAVLPGGARRIPFPLALTTLTTVDAEPPAQRLPSPTEAVTLQQRQQYGLVAGGGLPGLQALPPMPGLLPPLHPLLPTATAVGGLSSPTSTMTPSQSSKSSSPLVAPAIVPSDAAAAPHLALAPPPMLLRDMSGSALGAPTAPGSQSPDSTDSRTALNRLPSS